MPFFRKRRPQGDEFAHGPETEARARARLEQTLGPTYARAHTSATPVGAAGAGGAAGVGGRALAHSPLRGTTAEPRPAPLDPAPLDPAPLDPAPLDPAPLDPVPADAAPVDPAPVDPAPVTPAPEPVTGPLRHVGPHPETSTETSPETPTERLLARVVAEPSVPVEETHYARLLAPGLLEVLALDDPDVWLSDEQVAFYGDLTAVWGAGRALLREVTADRHETVEEDEGRALVLRAESPHLASTILVLPDVVAHRMGVAPDPTTGVFVAIPHRRVVVLHVVRDASASASLQLLVRLALAEFVAADVDDAISPDVHWWHDGRFETVVRHGDKLGEPAVTEVGAGLGEVLQRLGRP